MGDEGLVAELPDARSLVRAAEAAWTVGLTHIEAFSPYPVLALPPPIMARPRRLTRAVGLMAILGGATGYFVQWLTTAWLYPLNVGGRAAHSWLAFVPITFESAVLAASLTAFVGMLVGARLPRLSRPLFDVEGFERASHDRFFLWVSAEDPMFDPRRLQDLLRRSGALQVASVPREVRSP